jgi:hypothetical protein
VYLPFSVQNFPDQIESAVQFDWCLSLIHTETRAKLRV